MRRNRRRAANSKLREAAQVILCPKCKEPVLPHRACPACGYYRGREVVAGEKGVRIAVDALGGEVAPAGGGQGAALFRRRDAQQEVIIVGQERRIHEALREELAAPGHITVHHASEMVEMGEHPGAAIRRKKDSSIRVCFELIRAGEAAAMVSAGNSGAVMAGALLVLG